MKSLFVLPVVIAVLLTTSACTNAPDEQGAFGTVAIMPESVSSAAIAAPGVPSDAQVDMQEAAAITAAQTPSDAVLAYGADFWEREEDLYATYSITQETMTLYAVVEEVQYHEAQDRYAVLVHPVDEHYDRVEENASDGSVSIHYQSNPQINEGITLSFLLDPAGVYCYSDPYDPAFTSSQMIPLAEFVSVADGKTSRNDPLYFEIETISGTVISARLWDMYYASITYEERKAAAEKAAAAAVEAAAQSQSSGILPTITPALIPLVETAQAAPMYP